MVIEVIRYLVTPGDEPAFEAAYRQAAHALEKSTACLGFSLTRATLERHRYLMLIYWDSPDGHQVAFRQSPLFVEFQESMGAYNEMVVESAHYRKTGVELTKKQLIRLSGPPK